MTHKTQKHILAAVNFLAIFGGLQALAVILNLNQIKIFIHTAIWLWLFLWLEIALLYDFHLKNPGSLKRARAKHESVTHQFTRGCKVMASAFWDRSKHLREWHFLQSWLNYLLLPGLLFWSAVGILYANEGVYFFKVQQIVIWLTSLAMLVNYWYLKEIFARNREVVDRDIFVAMSVVKIYTSGLMYAVSLVFVRGYCLSSGYLFFAVFALTFLLLYQALFQHRLIFLKNLLISLGISLIMAAASVCLLALWGYNYFTGAVFLAAAYNLMWAIFHYHLDRALTWKAFWEIFVLSIIIGIMLLSVTNFKARLPDSCRYSLPNFTF